MNLLVHPVDDAISNLLSLMGESLGVDRAWMLEYRSDMLRFRNTHEWCQGQTQPFVAELQDVPTTLISWLHKYMAKGCAVAVPDVMRLPRSARVIQTEFLRQGNKSVLSVPVFCEGKLIGAIGFDTTVDNRMWSESEINALWQCANLIGQAKYGKPPDSHAATPFESAAPLLYLSTRGVVRGVPPEFVVGARSAGNYSEIWLANGSMVLDSRPLGLWSTLLPEKSFFRIHRTSIVNALHITAIDRSRADKWFLQMRSIDAPWPVSRAHRNGLRERMGI